MGGGGGRAQWAGVSFGGFFGVWVFNFDFFCCCYFAFFIFITERNPLLGKTVSKESYRRAVIPWDRRNL